MQGRCQGFESPHLHKVEEIGRMFSGGKVTSGRKRSSLQREIEHINNRIQYVGQIEQKKEKKLGDLNQ